MSHEFMFRLNNLEDRLVIPALMVVVCLLADGFRPYVLVCGTLCLVGWALLERASWQDFEIAALKKKMENMRRVNEEQRRENASLYDNNLELSVTRCEKIKEQVEAIHQLEAHKTRHNKLVQMLEHFTCCLDTLSVSRETCRQKWYELMTTYKNCLVYIDVLPLRVPVFKSVSLDVPAKYVDMFKLEAVPDANGKIRYYLPADGLKPRVPVVFSYRDLTKPDYYWDVDVPRMKRELAALRNTAM